MEGVHKFISEVGYPVLVRPSYVLSGAAMNVCHSDSQLKEFLDLAVEVSDEHPVVISSFIQRCKEIECDAVADRGKVLFAAISEHIEFAGVHSGDATIQFPARRIYAVTAARIRKVASAIARELNITGPFNIQFLSKGDSLKVIECNLRASRSFPFVSKVMGINMIELATKAMLGESPEAVTADPFALEYTGIKCSQFSFSRLNQADPVSGVDMASTGEVGCLGDSTAEALLKGMLSVGYRIPKKAVLISSGDALQKADLLNACKLLVNKGLKIYATGGTWAYLKANGIAAEKALWPDEAEGLDGRYSEGILTGETADGIPATDLIRQHKVDLVVNIPKNLSANELERGYKVRRAAVDFNVPLLTDSRLAAAFIDAFCNIPESGLAIKARDGYGEGLRTELN